MQEAKLNEEPTDVEGFYLIENMACRVLVLDRNGLHIHIHTQIHPVGIMLIRVDIQNMLQLVQYRPNN